MSREDKYTTHVEPFLDKIKEMYVSLNEAQIAKALGISRKSFTKYKQEHPELRQALLEAQQGAVEIYRNGMKRKALGYYYDEQKTVEHLDGDGNLVDTTVEKYHKYAHPDTGALHLLLKNYDPTWHNDDSATLKIKQDQVEIAKKKAEQAEW